MNINLRDPRYKHEFIDRVQFEWWSPDPGGGGNSDVSNFSKLISLTNNVPIFLSNFFFQPNMASIKIVALSFGTIYSMLGHPVPFGCLPKKKNTSLIVT